MFYKVIYNNIIIDILKNPTWVLWLKNSKRFILSDIITANGVISSDKQSVYNLSNRGTFENTNEVHKSVYVVEITESEYNFIKAQLVDNVLNKDSEVITLAAARKAKIEEMSAACEQNIVNGFDMTDKVFQVFVEFFAVLVPDFISDAPQNNAGMAPVAPDHSGYVFVVPFIEEQIAIHVVVRPFVVNLVDDKKTHFIAEVVQLLRHGIMGGADGVRAQLFDGFQPALPDFNRHRRAHTAAVVMQIHAPELGLYAV